MRTISAAGQAALDSGRYGRRCLLKADVDGGPFAIWDELGDIVVGGTTYLGRPGAFTIGEIVSSADLAAYQLDVSFSGLEPSVLAMVNAGGWHMRPIIVQRAIFAWDAPQTLHLMPVFAGFLDEAPGTDTVGGTSEIVFRCESTNRLLSRAGTRTRSDADQRLRDANDGFFKAAISAITTNIDWGRTVQAPQRRGGIIGLLDKIF